MILPAALLGRHVFAAWGSDWDSDQLRGAVGVFLAIAIFTVLNRTLVTGFVLLVGIRGRDLAGSWEDNMLELATLCLGGLAAVALLYNPALTILVLIPMVLLQRAALVKQLEVAATTDSKTGLLNAVTWEQLAQRDLARSARENTSTAIMIIDLDRFKLVNDSYGHLAGDAALKEVGRLLTAELRGYDTVGRFGGEEFVAVLPTTDEAHAVLVAERVRERIAGVRMSALITIADPTEDRNLTVSIGVACSPQDGTEVSELLHAADLALYRAKQTGRNRVEVAGRDTGSDAPEKSPVTA
jgi:diguanylate cyclase (GGDEF)-like protein